MPAVYVYENSYSKYEKRTKEKQFSNVKEV